MNKFWTPLCDSFEIDVPIFGFAHDIATVAAISNAGGYGVYGATRRFPAEITEELAYIRGLTGSKPFGVDLVLLPGMSEHNSRAAIEEHDIEPLIHSGAGQSIAYFNQILSVADIMDDLVVEARESLSKQAKFLGH
jgi:NAD(P)H-dependent flavin oxidoreductase YrpB (nitropropane dioxygenase family)